jgi:uncharacterized protein YaiI (UPF0178 family)
MASGRPKSDRTDISTMKIWVDADACPGVIRDILFRAAERTQVPLVLIANRMLRVPPSPWIRSIQVPSGFDVADQRIAEEATPGDLIITSDIPLAAKAVTKGAHVIDFRGELLDGNNIQERLTMRNFMEGLRNGGIDTGGPATFSAADGKAFANRLDGLLTKLKHQRD